MSHVEPVLDIQDFSLFNGYIFRVYYFCSYTFDAFEIYYPLCSACLRRSCKTRERNLLKVLQVETDVTNASQEPAAQKY